MAAASVAAAARRGEAEAAERKAPAARRAVKLMDGPGKPWWFYMLNNINYSQFH